MNTQEFLLWEMRSRDTIDVKRCYVDIAGDLVSGVLLSQIIYWHLPDEQGRSKLRVHHDGHDWLAKKRDDWWDECRVSPKQFDRAADILEKRGLVVTHLYRFAGSPTKHIRMNWDGFFKSLKSLQDAVFPQRSKSNSSPPDSIFPKGQNPNSPDGEMEIDEEGKIYTKSPAENPTENTFPPTPQGAMSEKEELTRNGGKPPAPNINSVISTAVIEETKQTTVMGEDKSSAAVPIQKVDYAAFGMQDPSDRKTRQQREFNWVPDGPWKVDNKLDNNFVNWLTAKWVRDYGKDVHTTRRNVQLHLKKDAANFAIAWDEYHREHLHRFSNAAVRERSGIAISPEEQQRLLQHYSAVTQAVPDEIASINYSLPAAVKEFTPDVAAQLTSPAPALPEGFEGDPNTYREYKPSVQVSEEEARANILRLKEMMQNRGGTIKALPAPEQPKPETILQQLVADLADPICRKDSSVQEAAQRFVGENEEYAADYDEAGMIVAIYQF